MAVRVDLTGKRFGRLTVVALAVDVPGKKKKWLCRCDCGNEVEIAGSNLQSGHSTQCKSCQLKNIQHQNVTHGLSDSRLYNVWGAMISRCERKNHKSYPDYGGRGISVCPEWHTPEVFLEWALTHGYGDNVEIDRIDTDGNYCPENCRWIPREENANNKRNNKVIDHDGKSLTLSEWARHYGVNYKNLSRCMLKGYTLEEAVKRLQSGDRHHKK